MLVLQYDKEDDQMWHFASFLAALARSAALVVGKGEVIFNSLKGKGAILVTFGKRKAFVKLS